MKYSLAIDIGASSGRHIVGCYRSGQLVTEEVYRFSNNVKRENGHLIWDTDNLVSEIKEGIDIACQKYEISSLSIDTWGVDYVLMDGDKEIYPCYAYRDNRTENAIKRVHDIIPFSSLYEKTGCQFQPFTTIYQLYDDKLTGRLDKATDVLLMPSYLMYKLCGVKSSEYTEATTTGFFNPFNDSFDKEILSKIGISETLFPAIKYPGECIGKYNGIDVVLCGTHDTASAVYGIPMTEYAPYISSGTWSLLGVKTDGAIADKQSEFCNYSNEGGVGYNLYQKNIMGLWLINELRREIDVNLSFDEITKMAENSDFNFTIDANLQCFISPESMKKAFDDELCKMGVDILMLKHGDYFRCAYASLAKCYNKALMEMEENIGLCFDKLYIVGGGAKNSFLNELTEKETGKEIIALPIEATAIGNLKVQQERMLGKQ